MSALSILMKADKPVTDFTITKIPKTNRQFYRVLHRIADTATPKSKKQFTDAIEGMRNSSRLKDLQIALEQGNIDSVYRALGINQLDKRLAPLVDTLRDAYNKAAISSIDILPKGMQEELRFDIFNPRAVDYARQRSAQLVSQVSEVTRQGIQRIITEGVEEGLTIGQQSKRIKELLALTPRQVSAVENFKAMLQAEGRKPAQVKRMVERYRQRQLKFRATRIARTETISAVNAGQEEVWSQAIDQGLLDMDARKFWVVTPDDKLCTICAPIPDDNSKGVPIGGTFETSEGMLEGPPAHPNCRCALSLEP